MPGTEHPCAHPPMYFLLCVSLEAKHQTPRFIPSLKIYLSLIWELQFLDSIFRYIFIKYKYITQQGPHLDLTAAISALAKVSL